jgi:hypothetical protein
MCGGDLLLAGSAEVLEESGADALAGQAGNVGDFQEGLDEAVEGVAVEIVGDGEAELAVAVSEAVHSLGGEADAVADPLLELGFDGLDRHG